MNELADLLQRNAGLIHRIAYAYCRNAVDRDDVVQEIAVQLWRSWPRYDPRFRETTWIYRIAINVAVSFHRRERKHRNAVEVDDQLIVVEPTRSDGDLELLAQCLDALAALDRALVVLYLDGLDHQSIAEVLGISKSNVGTKLARLKERLRTAYERKQNHGPR